MDGVGGDVYIAIFEFDVNDNEVMDMIHVIPNALFGELSSRTTNDQIPCCADGDLVRNMRRKVELAVIPAYFNLSIVSPAV